MNENIAQLIGDLEDVYRRSLRFDALVAHLFDEHQKVEDDPAKQVEAELLKGLLEFAMGTRSDQTA